MGEKRRCTRLVSGDGQLAIMVLVRPGYIGELLSDGRPLLEAPPVACTAAESSARNTTHRLGDRLVDFQSGLVVLCTRAGDGVLTFDGRELVAEKQRFPPQRRSSLPQS